jgi:hypothetical protein
MATTPMNRVIQHLLAACGRDGMTDEELLTRFLTVGTTPPLRLWYGGMARWCRGYLSPDKSKTTFPVANICWK